MRLTRRSSHAIIELTGQYHSWERMTQKAQHILRTAETLFAAGRYHEVTLDDICRKAGVGKGTVYRYFRDKEDLYYQVILSGLDELVLTVEKVGKEEQDPGKGLEHVSECVAHFFTERRCLFRVMWSEQLRGSTRHRKVRQQQQEKTSRLLAVMAAFVRRGVEEGKYNSQFSPEAAARLLYGMIRVGLRNREEMPGGSTWPSHVTRLFQKGLSVDHA